VFEGVATQQAVAGSRLLRCPRRWGMRVAPPERPRRSAGEVLRAGCRNRCGGGRWVGGGGKDRAPTRLFRAMAGGTARPATGRKSSSPVYRKKGKEERLFDRNLSALHRRAGARSPRS